MPTELTGGSYSPVLAAARPAATVTAKNAPSIKALVAEAKEDEIRCRAKMKRLGVVFSQGCTDISAIVKNLAVGVYTFNKPVIAYVDAPFHLALVLKTNLKHDTAAYFQGLAGEVTSREGKFSQSTTAKLAADDLTVSPLDP